MALPKKNRLTTKKEIDEIFKTGRTVRGSSLFVRFIHNQGKYSRFAFTIPAKNIPLAVDRNKVRRILSAEIIASPSLPKEACDIIIFVSEKVERGQFGRLGRELRKILLRI